MPECPGYTLQHPETLCNTLRNTLQQHATPRKHKTVSWPQCPGNTLQHPATPCNTLQYPATLCNTVQHPANTDQFHGLNVQVALCKKISVGSLCAGEACVELVLHWAPVAV